VKKSEAVLALSEKLQRSQNLFDGYKNGSISLKCLCDNLADRAIRFSIEKVCMMPPSGNWEEEWDDDEIE